MMKRFYSFGLLFFILIINCEPAEDNLAAVLGEVTDSDTGEFIEDALVRISSPNNLSDATETDSLGRYSFPEIDISEETELTLEVTNTGYDSEERDISIQPGGVTQADFELTETSTGEPGDDEEGGVEGEPGLPAAIILSEVTQTAINIRQTGGTVTSSFAFVVRDSAGRKMDDTTPVDVNFRIIKGPGGGEAVVPATVQTDADGEVVTNLFSGDSAGVVRVEAFINREDGEVISSSPILIAINGGFPSPDRFFVAPVNFNLEGFSYIDPSISYAITASVGDRYGNPVKQGTAVDFRTEAGRIDGSSTTDDRGFATVNLTPDGDAPQAGTADAGFFTVTAKTVDENNDYISNDIELLFTTRQAIITFDGGFNVPSNGSDNVSFTVTDLNGRPMAAGTTIAATAAGTIEVTGDANITLGDYFTGGPGVTEFTVSLADIDEESNAAVSTTLTVTVTTPSDYSTSATISGIRAKTAN